MDEQDKEQPAGMPEDIETDGVLAEPQPEAAETTGEAYTDVDRPHDRGEDEQPEQDASGEPVTETLTADQLLMGIEQPADNAETAEAEMLAILEAIVYITDEPLSAKQIADAVEKPLDYVKDLLDKLVDEYNKTHHGLTVKEVAGGYKMTTKPEHHEAVRAFVKNLNPPLKLSLAALETLAVIAYKQPITAPEIMEIRGVQGAGVLKTLLDRKLITSAGRKNVVGKPILYKTTKEFLVQFGLRDLNELPSLKEFEDLRRFAFSDADEAPLEAASTSQESSAEAAEATGPPEPAEIPEPAETPEPVETREPAKATNE
jgi:segregation and condensation protein B